MGIMPRLREAATTATAMSVVDDRGRQLARVRMPSAGGTGAEVEIPRGDLATVLFDAARDDAEVLFDDTIVTLAQDGDGVDVTFDRAGPRRFDLVMGADGLHSVTRRSAFGPESEFVEHLGIYVATVPLGEPSDHRTTCSCTTRRAGWSPSTRPAATRWPRSSSAARPSPDFDYRDTAQHKRIVTDAYAAPGGACRSCSTGWRRPTTSTSTRSAWCACRPGREDGLPARRRRLLRVPLRRRLLPRHGRRLHARRGARRHHRPRHRAARYETVHRRLVQPKQRRVNRAAGLLIPKTRLGIAARNLVARLVLR
jgi:2-polyprenyl-6-methoxyphenol hydroxylase-like FAD-dependent oxidoreductase